MKKLFTIAMACMLMCVTSSAFAQMEDPEQEIADAAREQADIKWGYAFFWQAMADMNVDHITQGFQDLASAKTNNAAWPEYATQAQIDQVNTDYALASQNLTNGTDDYIIAVIYHGQGENKMSTGDVHYTKGLFYMGWR